MTPQDPPPTPSSLPPRIRLMGMPIDVVTQDQAIAHILSSLARRQGGWVITPNLDQLRLYHANPALHALYDQATLILADGMPLIWASKLQGTPLPERVPGSQLIYTLTQAAAPAGRSIFLLGGNPTSADAAANVLKSLNPTLQVAGTHCPPLGFEQNPTEQAAITQAITQSRPDIVFVGLGFPKQEHLIQTLRQVHPAAWYLGVGISFSFVSGQIKRAPQWMQNTGIEWMHRMKQEPGRLFNRYVIHDLPFAIRLFTRTLFKK